MPEDKILDEAYKILNEPTAGLTDTGNGFMKVDKQASFIKSLSIQLHWKRKTVFSFILKAYPEYRERLKSNEIKHSNLSAVYQLMTTTEKSSIIKRLNGIKNRNKSKNKNRKEN